MGSGQPFYNYGNGQNNGFVAQPSQQSYFGAQQPQMPSQQPLPLVPPNEPHGGTEYGNSLHRPRQPVYLSSNNRYAGAQIV